MDYASTNMNYICAIACVSAERGITFYRTYNKAIDQTIFVEFLRQLSRTMGGKPFTLFMDRLQTHLCVSVREEMKALCITAILNVSYMP